MQLFGPEINCILSKNHEGVRALHQHAKKFEICKWKFAVNEGSQWNDVNKLCALYSWRCKQNDKWHIIRIAFKIFIWKMPQRKGLVPSKRSVPYYNNSMTSQPLILSGDIAENPGPDNEANNMRTKVTKRIKAPKCPSCEKSVQSNHKKYLCDVCFDLFHAKCTGISECQIKSIRTDKHYVRTCSRCTLSLLPFQKISVEEMIDVVDVTVDVTPPEDDICQDYAHLISLNSNVKHLKIMHINTQSMVSTFDHLC